MQVAVTDVYERLGVLLGSHLQRRSVLAVRVGGVDLHAGFGRCVLRTRAVQDAYLVDVLLCSAKPGMHEGYRLLRIHDVSRRAMRMPARELFVQREQ